MPGDPGRGFWTFFDARPRYSRNPAWSPRNAGVAAFATLFAATSSASSWTLAPERAAQIPLLMVRPFGLGIVSESRSDAVDGFAMKLADARFGEAEDFADLAEATFFLIIEPEYELQPLGELRDFTGDLIDQLADGRK